MNHLYRRRLQPVQLRLRTNHLPQHRLFQVAPANQGIRKLKVLEV